MTDGGAVLCRTFCVLALIVKIMVLTISHHVAAIEAAL